MQKSNKTGQVWIIKVSNVTQNLSITFYFSNLQQRLELTPLEPVGTGATQGPLYDLRLHQEFQPLKTTPFLQIAHQFEIACDIYDFFQMLHPCG